MDAIRTKSILTHCTTRTAKASESFDWSIRTNYHRFYEYFGGDGLTFCEVMGRAWRRREAVEEIMKIAEAIVGFDRDIKLTRLQDGDYLEWMDHRSCPIDPIDGEELRLETNWIVSKQGYKNRWKEDPEIRKKVANVINFVRNENREIPYIDH